MLALFSLLEYFRFHFLTFLEGFQLNFASVYELVLLTLGF